MRYAEGKEQESEKDYPYLARDEKCRQAGSKGKVLVSKIHSVEPNSSE